MGEVYEAVVEGEEGFAKTGALKVVRQDAATRPEFMRLFVTEARLATRLSHPNIVQVYHFGRSPEGYYLLMEYVKGIDLGEFIERHRTLGRPLRPDLACGIASSILAALDYAVNLPLASGDKLGLIHRDVCPSNVMLSLEGDVKVGDFGIAQAFRAALSRESGDPVARYMGRPEYLAPEVLEGSTPTPSSDVFSAGATLYTMLTLHQPFHHPETMRTIENVRFGPVPDPADLVEGIHPRLTEITLTALEKSPSNRYQDAFQFLEALAGLENEQKSVQSDWYSRRSAAGNTSREGNSREAAPSLATYLRDLLEQGEGHPRRLGSTS